MASLEVEKDSYKLEKMQRHRNSYKRAGPLLLVAVTIVTYLQWLWPLPYMAESAHSPNARKDFAWEDISPSKTLEYHSCLKGFQCARLEVPLNWNETILGEGDKVVIAIIKKPAQVEVTDPRYGGPILFNPGGPGGSGVAFLQQYADAFRVILDSGARLHDQVMLPAEEEKFYDLMSWDPRGIGHTTPGHGCISNPIARQTWEDQGEAIGFDLQDPSVFSNVWSRGISYGQTCASSQGSAAIKKANEDEHVGQYVSTANVVRDMVEIIERHGEWREKRAEAVLSRSCQAKDDISTIRKRTEWQKGEEQIQYWGFSYGTVLGQTFATMQPHRVKRLVLDGVVDAEDYTRNAWSKNLNDIDTITDLFTTACFTAGPSRCAFWDSSGSLAIKAKLELLLDTLKRNPVSVVYNSMPTTITHSDVVFFLFANWYNPFLTFPLTAYVLEALHHNNGTFLASFRAQKIAQTCTLPSTTEPDTSGASMAILCTDGDTRAHLTKSEFRIYIATLRNQSSLFGSRWTSIPLPCKGYAAVRAKWRFPGPFGATPAHPILFVSQRLDPVTPLRNAVAAAGLFPGSVYVALEGAGHCSLAMPSVRGLLAVRRYFASGEMPVNGTRFPVDVGFFDGEGASGVGGEGEVLEAGRRVAATWPYYERREMVGEMVGAVREVLREGGYREGWMKSQLGGGQ